MRIYASLLRLGEKQLAFEYKVACCRDFTAAFLRLAVTQQELYNKMIKDEYKKVTGKEAPDLDYYKAVKSQVSRYAGQENIDDYTKDIMADLLKTRSFITFDPEGGASLSTYLAKKAKYLAMEKYYGKSRAKKRHAEFEHDLLNEAGEYQKVEHGSDDPGYDVVDYADFNTALTDYLSRIDVSGSKHFLEIWEGLKEGESAIDMAKKFGISKGRMSQLVSLLKQHMIHFAKEHDIQDVLAKAGERKFA